MRLGLCCLFKEEPIKFRTTTAKFSGGLSAAAREEKLSGLCWHNAESLGQAILFCDANGIGAFRVNSRVLPLKTHPLLGYDLSELPRGREIIEKFKRCGKLARKFDIRLTFHPDQFTLLSSPNQEITQKSIEELKYQAEVCEWIGADVINIHAGGAYGDKENALKRVAQNIENLDESIRGRLTLENDDRVYTPADLLPICQKTEIPFVYDVHHHRCLTDGMSVAEVTDLALQTWSGEPLFHISSPREKEAEAKRGPHHDYIDPADFPECWKKLNITVDVEAKAKELAVIALKEELAR